LLASGGIDPHRGGASNDVVAFDAVGGRFARVGSLELARTGHTMTALADGRHHLVVGGRDASGQALSRVGVYDAFTGVERAAPATLLRARFGHTITALALDNPVAAGALLACGGVGGSGAPLDTCE